jgi:uncharacterized spore protein YtfJ
MSKADPRDWSDEEIEALLERLEEHVDTDTELGQAVKSRRRDVLKAIGALGAGGVAGAAGMEAASQQAQAADTSVGQIGSSGSPVDVAIDEIKDDGGDLVADIDDTGDVDFKRGVASPAVTTGGVDNEIADAAIQVAWDGLVVPVGQGVGASDAIDPSTTPTPVSDAADVLRNAPGTGWSGHIILPPETVQNDSAVTLDGYGGFVASAPRLSTIEFTSDTKGLINNGAGKTFIRGGLVLKGPGMTNSTNPAISHEANAPVNMWETVRVEGWQSVYRQTSPGYFYRIGYLNGTNIDPNQTGEFRMLKWGAGASNHIGTLILSNSSTPPSGTNPIGAQLGCKIDIDQFEAIGAVGPDNSGAMNVDNGQVSVGFFNVESGSTTYRKKAMATVDTGQLSVDTAHAFDQDLDHCWQLANVTGGRMAVVDERGTTNVGTSKVRVNSPPNRPIKAGYEQSDVQDATGTTGWAAGVECADGYLKP